MNTKLAQAGLLSDPTPAVEYLTFVLNEGTLDSDALKNALSMISNVSKSIGQKDATCNFSILTAFSKNAWTRLFPDSPVPANLEDFKDRKNGERHMPSTPGDIFFMIKSTRMDLNYEAAKHLLYAYMPIATLTDDVQGYKYLDDRDMINFVDGTENPKGDERVKFVLVDEDPYKGASYLTVQKYIDIPEKWDSQTTEYQEGVIGRSKMDDIEIADNKKMPYAHNVKTKVYHQGNEVKMLRQNRPFGNALQHGTMFIGFAKDPSVISTSLDQMVFPDSDGNYDKLLDFVTTVSGTNYFVPPQSFMDQFD